MSKGTSTDTVAVGFWLCDLNGGPTDWVGAVDSGMVDEVFRYGLKGSGNENGLVGKVN